MKYVYGVLCVLGSVLPYWQFIPWLLTHGLDIPLLIQEASQLRISAFAWLDVLVSAIVLLSFIGYEGRRLGMKTLWLPILSTAVVGVSLGLPLFLLMREQHLEQQQQQAEIADIGS
ncbi:MAG: DUF2834 domain-containing protein [Thainema sp.]